MKIVLFIAFLICSCSKSDVQPVFPSLEGKWKFSAKDVSGEFSIVQYTGKLTCDNGVGDSFVVLGTKYTVDTKRVIEGTVPSPFTIFLISTNNVLTFRDVDVNKTFTVINVGSYDYYVGTKSTVGTDKITITR